MKKNSRLRLSALLATASLLLANGTLANADEQGDAVLIDSANNLVTDASGQPLVVISETGDEAQSTTRAKTATGTPVTIIHQSSPRETVEEIPPPEISEEDLLAAQQYAGALPPELVGTDFTTDGNAQRSTGELEASPADTTAFTLRYIDAITYDVTVNLYRNGAFEVTGGRYPAPAHEIYGGWDNGNGEKIWRPLARLDNQGFPCLTGLCGTWAVYGSEKH